MGSFTDDLTFPMVSSFSLLFAAAAQLTNAEKSYRHLLRRFSLQNKTISGGNITPQ